MRRPVTPAGYALLRKELLKLKAQRGEVALAIEVARSHGDISENADYDAAKNKSGMIEAKIRDLELKIASSDIIDPLKISSYDKVVFGVTVTLEDVDTGEKKKVTIVGAEDSAVEKGYISYEAPLGKALIGKENGDVAKVSAPGGDKEYEITSIAVEYEPPLIEDESIS